MVKKISILLVLFVLIVASDQLRAADTLKIHLTYKYKVDDNGQAFGYKTIKQQFYTPDDTFFREINYDETTGQISSYIFRFYRNGKLFTEECHDASDNLLYILKHEFDEKGNETVVTKLVPSDKGFSVAEKSVKKYNSAHQVISGKKYFGKKAGMATQYKYDASGTLILEKTVYKQIANADVKQEVRAYSHSENGNIKQINVSGKDNSGKPVQFSQNFAYNDKGWVSSVKQLNADGQPAFEKIYKYLQTGLPLIYEEHDSTGKLTLRIQYDYKKHYMERGIQVSKYENL